MKRFFLLILFGWAVFFLKAQPPNNSIFFGGNGDGSMVASFSPAVNLIFAGSTGDGFSNTTNNPLINAIFRGSIGDGFAVQTNSAVSNSIFLGSPGDGFSQETNNASSNLIFLGSTGDGFVNTGNAALPNSIFAGGQGDGWHAVLLPLGPLPVTLLSFTAQKVDATHLIKWITTAEINTSHFEIQHSANARDFIVAGSVAAAAGNGHGASYSFTILNPWEGNNFYRLKMVDKDGSIAYSNIVLLKNSGALQVAVFPNPTADLLYVSTPIVSNGKPIVASLLDANGRLLAQPLLTPGINNAIRVGHLPAGVYTLQCLINNQVFVCRFLKKS